MGTDEELAGIRQSLIDLTGELSNDYNTAGLMMLAADTPFARRTFVRTAFAYIEGITSGTRHSILRFLDKPNLAKMYSSNELSLLRDDRARRRALEDIPEHWWFVFTMHQRPFELPDLIDKRNDVGWENLKRAALVRHRIVHPSIAQSLAVSDEDIGRVRDAFHWVNERGATASCLIAEGWGVFPQETFELRARMRESLKLHLYGKSLAPWELRGTVAS
jgi:hypothetical protein